MSLFPGVALSSKGSSTSASIIVSSMRSRCLRLEHHSNCVGGIIRFREPYPSVIYRLSISLSLIRLSRHSTAVNMRALESNFQSTQVECERRSQLPVQRGLYQPNSLNQCAIILLQSSKHPAAGTCRQHIPGIGRIHLVSNTTWHTPLEHTDEPILAIDVQDSAPSCLKPTPQPGLPK